MGSLMRIIRDLLGEWQHKEYGHISIYSTQVYNKHSGQIFQVQM